MPEIPLAATAAAAILSSFVAGRRWEVAAGAVRDRHRSHRYYARNHPDAVHMSLFDLEAQARFWLRSFIALIAVAAVFLGWLWAVS